MHKGNEDTLRLEHESCMFIVELCTNQTLKETHQTNDGTSIQWNITKQY